MFTEFEEVQSQKSKDNIDFKQNSPRDEKDGWDTFGDDWDFTVDNERQTKIDTKNKTKSL
jgi:hypothetical protein